MARLQELLSAIPISNGDVHAWFRFLRELRAVQGNASNDLSLVACILARDYLCRELDIAPFDVIAKAQNAPGLDIDVLTRAGQRVIAEVKTMVPYLVTDFGAQQGHAVRADLAKLRTNDAWRKFYFVTDFNAYNVLNQKYVATVPALEVVLLIPPPANTPDPKDGATHNRTVAT